MCKNISKIFFNSIKAVVPPKTCDDQFIGIIEIDNQIVKWQGAKPNITDKKEREKRHNEISNNNGLPVIVVILESPHKKEFENEPFIPAMGKTGENFVDFFDSLLTGFLKRRGKKDFFEKDKYRVVLLNAIQYQCSLGIPTKYYRTKIFKNMWETNSVQNDFIKRIKKYKPFAIINCCTGQGQKQEDNLHRYVQELLKKYCEKENAQLLYSTHPSSWSAKSKIHKTNIPKK